MTFHAEYDVVVAGGGSAGCVVAARVSEDAGTRVALLEAGPPDRNPWIHIPVGFGYLVPNADLTYGYETEPEKELDDRRVFWPRGRVLGGSGSINGLVFLRGAPTDFDEWERLGAKGWDYAACLPIFKRMEHQTRGADEWHGTGGPMTISDVTKPSEAAAAWIESCAALQVRRNDDFNGERIDGVGMVQLNVRDGRRCSTAVGYLHPAMKRRNLSVITGARVRRILLEGRRAIGVEIDRNGRIERIRARQELVISGGAINSPQLLLASGIGPAAELKAAGVEVHHDLPGVGKNLQDHMLVRMSFRTRRPTTLNDIVHSPLRAVKTGLEYALTRKGPLTVGAVEATMFIKSDPLLPVPDLQYQFVNFSLDSYKTGLHKHSGVMFNFCVCRPDSRGEILLSDPEGLNHPRIMPRYLSDKRDLDVMVKGFRFARRITATRPFSDLIAEEFVPGHACASDDDFVAYMRATASTVYHPCGTCRMGSDDKAVVDPQLRVRGIEGLRVVDASVMPMVPSSNIHPATIMVAERASDFIKASLKAPVVP